MNAEVDSRPRVENAYLRLLRGRLAFVRFALAEINYRGGRLPKRIGEASIELRRMINRHRLCHAGFLLRDGG
jgi:hypothetical protein